MTKQSIIDHTVKIINQLPEAKAVEISDFADFVINRYEEQSLSEDIQNIISGSQSFDFLREEEEMYSLKDLKQIFSE
mgnify:CR=1 FL=1